MCRGVWHLWTRRRWQGKRTMAFTGVLPRFEKLLISRDTYNNRMEFDMRCILGNGLWESEYSPPPPSIPPKINGNATRKSEEGEENGLSSDFHRPIWREDLVWSSGEYHCFRDHAVPESVGQIPKHSSLPSKPQVADKVPSLARNVQHHHSQNHSFASSRMPRKSIMTKLPIWFDSLTTCRHDHNVWLSFFIIVICKSTVTVARAKQRFFFQVNLLCNKCES